MAGTELCEGDIIRIYASDILYMSGKIVRHEGGLDLRVKLPGAGKYIQFNLPGLIKELENRQWRYKTWPEK